MGSLKNLGRTVAVSAKRMFQAAGNYAGAIGGAVAGNVKAVFGGLGNITKSFAYAGKEIGINSSG